MNNRPIQLAILGLGTVGTGVVELLQNNLDEMTRRTGREIKITHAGTRRNRADIPTDIKQSADLLDIVQQDDVDIVVELMGGTTTAK